MGISWGRIRGACEIVVTKPKGLDLRGLSSDDGLRLCCPYMRISCIFSSDVRTPVSAPLQLQGTKKSGVITFLICIPRAEGINGKGQNRIGRVVEGKQCVRIPTVVHICFDTESSTGFCNSGKNTPSAGHGHERGRNEFAPTRFSLWSQVPVLSACAGMRR